jgi:hypothetical protein
MTEIGHFRIVARITERSGERRSYSGERAKLAGRRSQPLGLRGVRKFREPLVKAFLKPEPLVKAFLKLKKSLLSRLTPLRSIAVIAIHIKLIGALDF